MTSPPEENHERPASDGEMARLIHDFDWSATTLGPLPTWPEHLRVSVDLILCSTVPMVLLWGHSGIMIYNDAYAFFAGKRHPQLLGKGALIGWPEVADFNQNVLDVVLQGGNLSYHDQPLTLYRNGAPEAVWLDLYYSALLRPDGKPDGVLAIVVDTSQRILAEQERTRSEEALRKSNHALQEANRDLEQFAFSASHDLQEPLRMISIYSQLLKRNYRTRLDEDADHIIEQCVAGATRMSQMLRDLLEYTQSSSFSDSSAPPVADLQDVLAGTLANLQLTIAETGATVSFDGLPAVCAEPFHMQQVFQNLIGNALKYRSARPPEIEIAAVKQERQWLLSIRDNGIGIDPQYREQIFGLFKRLHTAKRYAGTGIGLAICRKIVESYGGRIWVESQANEGATFFFSLPEVEVPSAK